MNGVVAITGAAGFIGSHLAKRLQSKGKELILIDDLSRGKAMYLKGVHFPLKIVDLRDRDKTFAALFGSDIVYHCACHIGGVQFLHGSAEKELVALQDNLAIDRNVFNACYEQNVKKVIFTSSVSVYNEKAQDSENCLLTEQDIVDQELAPEGGYGWSKFLGEMQLRLMEKTGMNVSAARIFKSYGPFDDYSPESGQVVTSLMRKAINYPKEKFEVWGDGSIKRCLLYIDDLVDALLLLERHNGFYNIGSNTPVSVKELAEKVVKLSGKRIKIQYQPGKHPGPQSRIPDLRKAKTKLGWEPTTSLDEGIHKTYSWMEEVLSTKTR